MKKLFFAVILFSLSVTTAFAAELPFTAWSPLVYNAPNQIEYGDNFEAIYQLKQQGIFGGYPDGTFRGDSEINRAEITKILVLASGVSETQIDAELEEWLANPETQAGFTDVDPDDRNSVWYVDYVLYAQKEGIVSGYPDGSFKPSDPVLLSELYKLVVESQYGTPDSTFQGEEWYREYINFLAEYGILREHIYSDYEYEVFSYDFSAVGFTGEPSSKATRAGAAELIYRLQSVWNGEGLQNFAPYLSLDEYAERFGASLSTTNDKLSIQDPHFHYQFTDLPLGGANLDDLIVYISDPSGFENGYYTDISFMLKSETFAESNDFPEDYYQHVFRVEVTDPDSYWANYYDANGLDFYCGSWESMGDSVDIKPAGLEICYDEAEIVKSDIDLTTYP